MLAIGELAILSAIIMALLIYSLTAHYRESSLKERNSKIQKEHLEFQKTSTEKIVNLEKDNLNLQAEINKLKKIQINQQEQIAEQEAQICIPAKYTFDPLVGCLIAISENKRYCTACFLQYKEVPLGFKGNPLVCPICKTDYNRPPINYVIHREPPYDPFRGI